MIKKFSIVILISALFFIALSSCNKESILLIQNVNQNSTNELKSLVSQVKFWHDSVVSNKVKGINAENNVKSFSLGPDDIIPPSIDFDKAYKNFDTVEKKGVSIPLEFNPITGSYLQFVTSIEKNKVSGYIVRTIPDSTYRVKHKNIYDFTNFTGLIIIYNIKGKFLNKIKFNEGVTQISNSVSLINTEKIKSFDDLQEVTVTGYRKKKRTYLVINQKFSYDMDYGGGGGWVVVGGDESPEEPPKIENKIKNPCLSSIVDKIINAKISDNLSNEINNIFGESYKINLYFNEKSIEENYTAESIPVYNPDGSIDCNINIDMSKFSTEVSDEFVASTIIHEISHMLIATTFTNSSDYNKNDREKNMLINYVSKMKIFLVDNFNTDPNHALSMIFSGLKWLSEGPGSNKVYRFWSQETEDMYFKIITENGFSLVYGDENYFTIYDEKFKNGTLGKKSCKF
jgi:hypothetical protein